MPPFRPRRTVVIASLLLAGLAAPAQAATDCELALDYAMTVADFGQRSYASENYYEVGQLAAAARLPAIDAAREAKACGCPDAIPFLGEAALAAERTNASSSNPSIRQYGYRIWKQGDAAVKALLACGAKGRAPPPKPQ